MRHDITITTLVENSVNIASLRAEHGLSFLIRAGDRKVLFDAGQSDLLLCNAEKMGLALNDLDAVVLSHGHYDHTGGVEAVYRASPQAKLYAHPSVLAAKFAGNSDGTSRFVGPPQTCVEVLHTPERRVTWTTKPTEILPGLFLTGEIPRTNDFEDTGGRFFLDAGCTRPDPLLDDQALYFESEHGLVVILGCAHAGVVNTLDYISNLTSCRLLDTVIGGMHLGSASPDRMKSTVEAFRRWMPRHIIPAHCTGIPASAQLMLALPNRCSTCPVGSTVVFRA
jgi:7,8-dihydropterin-6-yl-methyl-4-(beta-D-ribofuranosyl)aminobenzene 5'-phosphate synthase